MNLSISTAPHIRGKDSVQSIMLDVLIALCDRVLVICGGRVTGILDGRTATKEEIGLLMTKTDNISDTTTEEKEEPNGENE